MNPRPRITRSRTGYSLIEMLMAIGVFGSLLAISLMFVELLLRLGEGGSDQVESLATVARLAEQFRRDLRGSERIMGEVTETTLELEGPGSIEIRYKFDGRDLERLEQVDGKLRRIEQYRLPEGPSSAKARFEVERSETAVVVSIVIDRRLGLRRGRARPFRITGRLGSARKEAR